MSTNQNGPFSAFAYIRNEKVVRWKTFETRIIKLCWQTIQLQQFWLHALIIKMKIAFAKSNRNLSIHLIPSALQFASKFIWKFWLFYYLEIRKCLWASVVGWRMELFARLNRFWWRKIGCTNIAVKVNRPIKPKQSVISALNVNTCGGLFLALCEKFRFDI